MKWLDGAGLGQGLTFSGEIINYLFILFFVYSVFFSVMRLYISMVAFIWTQIPGVLDHLDLSSKTVLFALMLDGTL